MKQEFRLPPDLYVVPVIWELGGIAFSVAAFFARRPNDFWPMQFLMLLLFHGPSIVGAWYIKRMRVFVDEEGIRFQGVGKQRFFAWDAIEDFGWELPPESNKSASWRASLWIGGKKKRLPTTIKNLDELRELIALRATNAPTRVWGLIGARDCDVQSQIFVYRDTPNWQLAATFFGVAGLMILKLVIRCWDTDWRLMATNISQMWNALEWWGRVGFAGVFAFLIFGLPTLILAMSCMGLKAKRRFLEQHITVTHAGLEQWNGPSRHLCTWNDIERFELETVPGSLQLPLCVVWARGQRFDWHSGIEKGRLLRALVEQRALNARDSEWQYRSGNDEDILGGEMSLWPSGVIGTGPKRYHYRTRSNRIFLVFGWAVLLPIVFLLSRSALEKGLRAEDFPNVLMSLGFLVPIGVSSIGGLRAYFASWIERDELGLLHKSLFGRRAIAWDAVQRAKWNTQPPFLYLEIRGDQKTIRLGLIADMEHLLADIESLSDVKVEREIRKNSPTNGKHRSG